MVTSPGGFELSHEWWRWGLPAVEPDPDPDPPVEVDGPWTTDGSMTAHSSAAAGAIDGRIYVAGGLVAGVPYWTTSEYNPATHTAAVKADMPGPRFRIAGGGLLGGKLYYAGGAQTSNPSGSRDTLYAYDPATNTWATKAAMPAARYNQGATLDSTVAAVGKLYVAGGLDNLGALKDTLFEYDAATNTWATRAPLPAPRYLHATASLDGKLYVLGGRAPGLSADVLVYDPATNTWATKAAMPYAREMHTAIGYGGRIYVIGGRGPNAGSTSTTTPRADVYVYDVAANTWSTGPEMPGRKIEHWTARIGSELWVGGGTQVGADVYRCPIVPASEEPEPEPEPEPAWLLDEDRSAGLISWAVTYGRQDYTARVAPTTATVALAGHYAAPCPASGDRVRLRLSEQLAAELGLTDDERTRFSGEVTDPVIDPRNPVSDVYTITAAGALGRYRRRSVDGRTWPAELDGARVERILAGAGAVPGVVEPGTRALIPPVRKVTAGQLLDQTSDSTGGQLVEQRTGALDWHGAEHRRGVPSTVTLDAAEIVNDLTFEQHVGDIINRLELSYGRDDLTVTVRDPGSIDERDVYESSLSTALANAIDAHDLGLEIVGRRADPVWQLPNLVVDLRVIGSPAKRAQLLALEHGDRLTVTGLPTGVPGLATTTELYVEGITETATPRAWRLSIAVSDPLLSGASLRYRDVDADVTFDQLDPDLTYLDATRIENPDDLEA